MGNVRAINGFKIRRFHHEDKKGIIIKYEINGEFFTQSKYDDVSEEKIKKVRERLDDLTRVNEKANELCSTIPMMTIINAVEDIIF